MFFAPKPTEAEPAKPVRIAGPWAGPLRMCFFGTLVLLLSLAFAPGAAQAHGAHAMATSSEQVTSVESIDGQAAEASSDLPALDCAVCCAPAGCLAATLGMNPAMPDFDAPGGAYAIPSVDLTYQAARQGLRRPPKLNI